MASSSVARRFRTRLLRCCQCHCVGLCDAGAKRFVMKKVSGLVPSAMYLISPLICS